MPTNKQKPSSSAKAAPNKKPGKAELSDDDLRSISGGMAAKPGAAGATDPVCVSSF
jgi:hypothetical protein